MLPLLTGCVSFLWLGVSYLFKCLSSTLLDEGFLNTLSIWGVNAEDDGAISVQCFSVASAVRQLLRHFSRFNFFSLNSACCYCPLTLNTILSRIILSVSAKLQDLARLRNSTRKLSNDCPGFSVS